MNSKVIVGRPHVEVGMGVTMHIGSDSYAGTIVAVTMKGKAVQVQKDRAVRTDSNGQSESQEYTYERNLEAEVVQYTLRKNGEFIRSGGHHFYLTLGTRRHYMDPGF